MVFQGLKSTSSGGGPSGRVRCLASRRAFCSCCCCGSGGTEMGSQGSLRASCKHKGALGVGAAASARGHHLHSHRPSRRQAHSKQPGAALHASSDCVLGPHEPVGASMVGCEFRPGGSLQVSCKHLLIFAPLARSLHCHPSAGRPSLMTGSGRKRNGCFRRLRSENGRSAR